MQAFSRLKTLFFICSISNLLLGCHLFQSTAVSSQEILVASKWSSEDIGPSFVACDEFDGEEMKNCFENIVSTPLSDYLTGTLLEANQSIEEELLLIIEVDHEGYFSLGEVDFSNALLDAIPTLREILEEAVHQLPQAKPAIKSNVGIFVSSQFQLPLRIVAQEKN